METFDYFAYGSNMLSERLKQRCPNAQSLGPATARGFRLAFCKKSNKDGSGKATLVETKGAADEVPGVLFRIPLIERDKLDRAEGMGSGYERCDRVFVIRPADSGEVPVTIYEAEPTACDENLRPYDWYRNLVLAGAIQHRLPTWHVARLLTFAVISDPKPERCNRKEALDALRAAGYHGLT